MGETSHQPTGGTGERSLRNVPAPRGRRGTGMNEADFTDFVTHRGAALLRTAFLLCGGDRTAAEDLLQDVLERAFPKWRRIRGRPEPYLRAALANTAANRWRSRSRRVREVPLSDQTP